MKRRPCIESNGADRPEEPRSAKKLREAAEGEKGSALVPVPVPELVEDAIYEVLRRADVRALAAAACVSRRWRRLAADERLWKAACIRHWEAERDYGHYPRRSGVLALCGFRRLQSLYPAPFLRPPSLPIAAFPSSTPAWITIMRAMPPRPLLQISADRKSRRNKKISASSEIDFDGRRKPNCPVERRERRSQS